MKAIFSVAAVLTLVLTVAAQGPAQTKVRIGVFDSRAVALAYYQSGVGREQAQQFRSQYDKAKADNNDKAAAAVELKAQTQQMLMHLQAFSIGSAAEILANYKDAVAAVAKEAKVSAVVSQWELAYQGPDVEIVDVTEALVRKINDSPKAVSTIAELKKQKPLSMLEALGIRD